MTKIFTPRFKHGLSLLFSHMYFIFICMQVLYSKSLNHFSFKNNYPIYDLITPLYFLQLIFIIKISHYYIFNEKIEYRFTSYRVLTERGSPHWETAQAPLCRFGRGRWVSFFTLDLWNVRERANAQDTGNVYRFGPLRSVIPYSCVLVDLCVKELQRAGEQERSWRGREFRL